MLSLDLGGICGASRLLRKSRLKASTMAAACGVTICLVVSRSSRIRVGSSVLRTVFSHPVDEHVAHPPWLSKLEEKLPTGEPDQEANISPTLVAFRVSYRDRLGGKWSKILISLARPTGLEPVFPP